MGTACTAGEPKAAGDVPEPLLLPDTLGIFLALALFVEVRFHSPVRGNGSVNGGSRLPG